MEKEKIVKINDMGTDKYFKVRLFSALEGLDFFDRALSLLGQDKTLSVRPFLGDLLKVCAAMDGTGEKILIPFGSLDVAQACRLLENPLAVLELGAEILKHQQVFTQDSELCRKLTETPFGGLVSRTSESRT